MAVKSLFFHQRDSNDASIDLMLGATVWFEIMQIHSIKIWFLVFETWNLSLERLLDLLATASEDFLASPEL